MYTNYTQSTMTTVYENYEGALSDYTVNGAVVMSMYQYTDTSDIDYDGDFTLTGGEISDFEYDYSRTMDNATGEYYDYDGTVTGDEYTYTAADVFDEE